MSSQDPSVAVTGIGVVSPIGLGRQDFTTGLFEGRVGVRRVQHFDPERLQCRRAGEIDMDAFKAWWKAPDYETGRLGRFVHFALCTAQEALADACGEPALSRLPGTGAVYSGIGMGGLGEVERGVVIQETRGAHRTNPYLIPSFIPSMAASTICRFFGFHGAQYTFAGACAGGAQAIGEAARAIARGDVDWALAGGTEAVVTPLGFSGFRALQAFTLDSERTPRPFDATRNGMIVGEGAGFFLLESLAHARSRGATVHGLVQGFATGSAGDGLTRPLQAGLVRVLRAALDDAGLRPQDVDVVISQANGAVVADRVEMSALVETFGTDPGPAVTSIEGHMGHLFGASAPLAFAAALQALRHQRVPPTCHFEQAEAGFEDLDVCSKPRPRQLEYGLVDSFGFGGVAAALVVQRAEALNS